MRTIGLRELNQNPSKAVARVRAGETIVVTDRGRPVLRLVPEDERPGVLQHLLDSGEVTPPAELGMPDLILELAPQVDRLSDLLIEDRDKERRR
jgi:prevent-host-death family protein